MASDRDGPVAATGRAAAIDQAAAIDPVCRAVVTDPVGPAVVIDPVGPAVAIDRAVRAEISRVWATGRAAAIDRVGQATARSSAAAIARIDRATDLIDLIDLIDRATGPGVPVTARSSAAGTTTTLATS